MSLSKENLTSFEDLPVQAPVWNASDPTQNVTSYSIPYCDVVIAEDLYVPPAFRQTERLKRTNELAIRFGASNNMMTLLDGTEEQQTEYIKGLLASSLVMAVFFAVWCIIMLFFKCLGHRRGGFLCGRFVRPSPPKLAGSLSLTEDVPAESSIQAQAEPDEKGGESSAAVSQDQVSPVFVDEHAENPENPVEPQKAVEDQQADSEEQQQAYLKKCHRQEVRFYRTRVFLIISSLCIIASSCCFCYYGDQYVNQSITSVKDGLRRIQLLCLGGIVIVDNYIIGKQMLANISANLAPQLSGMCPPVSAQLCEQVEPAVQNCSFKDIPYIANSSFAEVFSFIYENQEYVADQLDAAKEDLSQLYYQVDDILAGSSHLDWVFWVSFGFAIALSVNCLVILWGIFLAHVGKLTPFQKFMRHQVMFPFFCFLVLVAFAFSFAFTIAAIGASDWCIGSPDSKVTYILDKAKEQEDSFAYQLADYYVNSCSPGLRPGVGTEKGAILVQFLVNITEFAETLKTIDPVVWNQTCGTDPGVLDEFATFLGDSACLVSSTLEDLNRYFWCRQWNPVYTVFMYESICTSAQTGLGWVAGTMFFVVFFSFITLLLRAGAFDIEDEESYLQNARRFRRCCYGLATCACCRHSEEEEDTETMENKDKQMNGLVLAERPADHGDVPAGEQSPEKAPPTDILSQDEATNDNFSIAEKKTDEAEYSLQSNTGSNDNGCFGAFACGDGLENIKSNDTLEQVPTKAGKVNPAHLFL